MSGPECWHPFEGEVTPDTAYCNDCGLPLPDEDPEYDE